MARPVRNIFTIDVEDWFQVENYASVIERDRWPELELRVEANVDRLLALLAAKDVRATFFILGWVAERVPELVRRVARAGHEVASHGWSHRPIWNLTREQFAQEVRRSRELLCKLSGQDVTGYRAPTFSITRETLWALESLAAAGYRYDSSIFPVHHDRYGIPDAPLAIHRRDEGLWEVPLSVFQAGSLRLPVAGGRLLAPLSPRPHVGIRSNERKLEGLLSAFPFAPAGEVIAELPGEASSRDRSATAHDPKPDAVGGN